MELKYMIEDYKDITEVKNAYRRLAFKLHPDVGGTVEDMQRLNDEYDYVLRLVNGRQEKKANINESKENSFKSVISELIKYKDIQVYIVGFYIWIDGNTKDIKEDLKKLGCLWSSSQKKWYYNGCQFKSKRNSGKNWFEITTNYGCYQVIEREKEEREKERLKLASV